MKKRQHYVPRSYLNSFAVKGRLCCFKRSERRFFETSSENICQRRYLYETDRPNRGSLNSGSFVAPNVLEDRLEIVEESCMPSLREVEQYAYNEIPSLPNVRDAIGKVAIFAVNLFFRNPNMFEHVRNAISVESVNGLREMLKSHGEPDDDLVAWANELAGWKTLTQWEEGAPQYNLVIELLTMDCALLKDTSGRFITSDVPVQIIKTESPVEYMLYYPISRHLAVLFLPSEGTPQLKTIDATGLMLEAFNGFYFTDECISDLCIASSEELLRFYAQCMQQPEAHDRN